MILYFVWNITGDNNDEFIAVYSTREKAENRIKNFVMPSSLYIDEVILDDD